MAYRISSGEGLPPTPSGGEPQATPATALCLKAVQHMGQGLSRMGSAKVGEYQVLHDRALSPSKPGPITEQKPLEEGHAQLFQEQVSHPACEIGHEHRELEDGIVEEGTFIDGKLNGTGRRVRISARQLFQPSIEEGVFLHGKLLS